jgi:AcrR family transcriptional regulator
MNSSFKPGDRALSARLDRPPLSREIVLAYRRHRLEAALAELCVEQGFRATTIADVSRRARGSRATIYEQFANKEALFIALFESAIAELREQVEAACETAAADPGERLEAGLSALLRWVAAEPASAWAVFVEAFRATPASMRLYLETIEGFTVLLAGVVPNEIPRPATTEESLVGGVAALLSGLIRGGQAECAPELAPQLLTFLRGPFLAPPGSISEQLEPDRDDGAAPEGAAAQLYRQRNR